MKKRILAASLMALPLQAAPVPPMEQLLAALSWAESRNTDTAIGKAGERGRWQITASCWAEVQAFRRMYGKQAFGFSGAFNPVIAKTVADDYLGNYIVKSLTMRGGM